MYSVGERSKSQSRSEALNMTLERVNVKWDIVADEDSLYQDHSTGKFSVGRT